MATIRFELRGSASAPQMIYFVISHAHQRDRISTGIKIEAKYWSLTMQKVKKSPNNVEINQKLAAIRNFVENIIFQMILNDSPLSYEKLKTIIDTEFRPIIEPTQTNQPTLIPVIKSKYKTKTVIPTELLTFAAYFIDRMAKEVSVTGKRVGKGTIKNYQKSLNHLTRFCQKTQLNSQFEAIDTEFISAYRTYLTIDADLMLNSMSGHIKVLKRFLSEAVELGANKNTAFRTYKSMKMVTENSDNVYLTETEIAQIYALDLSEDWRLQNVRDWFVIACEMGLRYSDWSSIDLSKIDNDRIEIIQHKTGDRAIIPLSLTQYFWQIVKRRGNNLPRIYTNQECNRSIKNIAKLANISAIQTITYIKAGEQKTERIEKYEMVTTHTARRTFATNTFIKGMPISLIMSITGHKTEKAFLLYVKAGVNEKADMLEKYLKEQKI